MYLIKATSVNVCMFSIFIRSSPDSRLKLRCVCTSVRTLTKLFRFPSNLVCG